ncbi:hypothetical protein SprV_0200650900 [Sparganum proliferum]
MIQQQAKSTGPVASHLPTNPLEHQVRSGAEFRDLNVRLLDKGFRTQLTSFLTCLGGQNIDEFVKRIFFAVFDNEISPYVNFQGRKTKNLSGSKLYEVILDSDDEDSPNQPKEPTGWPAPPPILQKRNDFLAEQLMALHSSAQQMQATLSDVVNALQRTSSAGSVTSSSLNLPLCTEACENFLRRLSVDDGFANEAEPQDANDSFETIPLGDEISATVPKEDGNEDILLLMCKHMRALYLKMDILLETNRKILGRQRLLESMLQQQAKAAGQIASQLPMNPLEHQIRSGAEFRNLNVQLLDNGFRNQLTSYLTCLGGHNLDEFVKRIFFAIFDDEISLHVNLKGRKTKERLSGSKLYEVILGGQNIDEFVKRIFFAVFDDEISLHVNFKGRKTKESLSGSKLYEVILEVFGAWNTDASVKLCDLESALTKRLKRSLDTCVQHKNKLQVNQDDSDNIPGSSTDSPPA